MGATPVDGARASGTAEALGGATATGSGLGGSLAIVAISVFEGGPMRTAGAGNELVGAGRRTKARPMAMTKRTLVVHPMMLLARGRIDLAVAPQEGSGPVTGRSVV